MPAAGSRFDTSLDDAGWSGGYWSRTLYSDDLGFAWYLDFGSSGVRMYYRNGRLYGRNYGQSIRPVRATE